jgi:hypothetical protein
LDFLGGWRFRYENPRFRGLDFLGFPWILSSETSLFNGLRWNFVDNIFAARFSCRDPGNGPAVEAMRKRKTVHAAESNRGSDFLQLIVVGAFLVPSIEKSLARATALKV